MPLLSVEKATKIYGGRRVVNGVSLEVNGGEVVGLLGRNGAGKTTTFRMVIGLVRANSGKITFKSKEVTRLPIFRRARMGMGFLPQEPSVFTRLTVEENLIAILETTRIPQEERQARAQALLEEYGLTRLAKQRAFTLSGGEERRLEICRALITNPSIILLDEPFSGVDPIAVSELQQFITRLKVRGIGVLLTDHNVRETLAICDRAYIITEGKVLCDGPPDMVVSDPQVRKLYLGEHFQLLPPRHDGGGPR